RPHLHGAGARRAPGREGRDSQGESRAAARAFLAAAAPLSAALAELRRLTLGQLENLVAELGEPRFRAKQLYRGIHKRGARSLEELTDLPKPLREKLAERGTL